MYYNATWPSDVLPLGVYGQMPEEDVQRDYGVSELGRALSKPLSFSLISVLSCV